LLDDSTTETQEDTMHYYNIALALGVAAIAALLPAGALAQPMHDAATPAKARADAVHRHHSRSATPTSITFTNPLGRSRGPGAGAGLL
jgi:hypothetical protein